MSYDAYNMYNENETKFENYFNSNIDTILIDKNPCVNKKYNLLLKYESCLTRTINNTNIYTAFVQYYDGYNNQMIVLLSNGHFIDYNDK